jgi:hypothetical protein
MELLLTGKTPVIQKSILAVKDTIHLQTDKCLQMFQNGDPQISQVMLLIIHHPVKGVNDISYIYYLSAIC